MLLNRQYSLATIFIIVSLAALVFAIVGYAIKPAKFYTADQIHVSDLKVHTKGIDVEFLVLANGSSTCPGITVEKSGDVIDLYFHRRRANQEDVQFEIPCSRQADGKYSVSVPIVFSKGQLRVNGTRMLYSKGK